MPIACHQRWLLLFVCLSVTCGSEVTGQSDRQPSAAASAEVEPHCATPSRLSCEFLTTPEKTVVFDPEPEFAWVCGLGNDAFQQSAYHIVVRRVDGEETRHNLPGSDDPAAVWDSGRVDSSQSINVAYGGQPLSPNQSYDWQVRTWNNQQVASDWSPWQRFRTAEKFSNQTSRYPVEIVPQSAQQIQRSQTGEWFIDFGQDAFGYLELAWTQPLSAPIAFQVRFGEKARHAKIDQQPGGTIRHYLVDVTAPAGKQRVIVRPPQDKRNTSGQAIRLPAEVGVIGPFRYVELIGWPAELELPSVQQMRIEYPFHEQASVFHSSDSTLNQIWRLCKYSIRATTFCGVYVDGDRERIPYEADAYINQLSHYGVDREYALARYSHEYLLTHATWPTEWKQHSILMAWADYRYTGNHESLAAHYAWLKQDKLLSAAARPDGLLDTAGRPYRDIVDWPADERDGYDLRPVNTVVNAFHYATLRRMAELASVLGHENEAEQFAAQAQRLHSVFNQKLWSDANHAYVDGLDSSHSSLHANLFPLAFDLVPTDRVDAVIALLRSRGMRCSVYAAQYLLEGLFEHGASDLAWQLLGSTEQRSWYNMIRVGSTITMEAWDQQFKPNLDWNHAWGAAPANLIPRYVVGVRPLEPGFRRIIIQPQPADLKMFVAKVPTIRGPVNLDYQRTAAGYLLNVSIPGNSTAAVQLPAIVDLASAEIQHNGASLSPGERTRLDQLSPGQHSFVVRDTR